MYACSGIPTLSRSSIAFSSAWLFVIPFTFIGASVTFSIMVRWGNSSNCWKTNPTSDLMYFRSDTLVSSSIVMPSTSIVPPLCGWSLFSVLMKVDLPDPDGPSMTIISPVLTVMSIPLRAQKSPKFTFTPFVFIISFSSFSVMFSPHLFPSRGPASSRYPKRYEIDRMRLSRTRMRPCTVARGCPARI